MTNSSEQCFMPFMDKLTGPFLLPVGTSVGIATLSTYVLFHVKCFPTYQGHCFSLCRLFFVSSDHRVWLRGPKMVLFGPFSLKDTIRASVRYSAEDAFVQRFTWNADAAYGWVLICVDIVHVQFGRYEILNILNHENDLAKTRMKQNKWCIKVSLT